MPGVRTFALMSIAVLASFALAQPSTAPDLTHALNTEAFVVDEPLGAAFDCDAYREVFPNGELACFELYMPAVVLRGRFQAYVADVDAFEWGEEDWLEAETLPGHVDPDDEHLQRTIVSTQGSTFRVSIFEVGRLHQVVVSLASE